MSFISELSLQAGAITATTQFEFDVQELELICIVQRMTAASGTNPVLNNVIEAEGRQSTWHPIERFPTLHQADVVNQKLYIDVTPFSRCRCNVTIGGTTPSFTLDLFLFSRVREPIS